ncbi:cytochrome P450 [Gonapodya prolifera JEL478]|uniref:Cytochrome P450 n=1 Tax=Gonapodya prolifera (strain JEL478) TaxID=1344416 RepID=A0A139ARV6_GONPJ|nr:cytochrome P450 [Gonapodya prolifera JEL478]|eukprot:KXS19462.1 cytochrome P450 [Gonapodya prolifera JEL478]
MALTASIAQSIFSLSWPATILLALVFLITVLVIVYPDRAFGTRYRPEITTGTGVLPVLGHLLYFGKTVSYRLEDQLRETRKVGGWYFTECNGVEWLKILANVSSRAEDKAYRQTVYNPATGPLDIIVTSHVKDVETILKDPYTFVKGELFASTLSDFLGQGIFNSDGERWHAQRKTASHVFNVKNFRAFSSDFLHEVGQLAEHLDAARDASAVVDLQDLLLRCTLDSFGRLAMGSDFGCIGQPARVKDGRYELEKVEFMEAFDYVNLMVAIRAFRFFWQLEERLDGTTAKIRAAQRVMFSFADNVISEKRRRMAAGESVDEEGRSSEGRRADMLGGSAAGVGICLGMNMATQEAVCFMAQLIRDFHLELVNEDVPEKWGRWDADPKKREGRCELSRGEKCEEELKSQRGFVFLVKTDSDALTLGLRGTVDFKVHRVK